MRKLPCYPRPYADELFSSWFLRLAHANVQRLPHFTFRITGDSYFWRFDPDRFLRPGLAETLAEVTGLSVDAIHALTLRRYEGKVVTQLPPRAPVRWIMPLYIQGYKRRRPGLSYCPACLREALFLRTHWRLSFVTVCERHACPLQGACPRCQAPYAPQRNDLGLGSDWSTQPEPPFGFCPECRLDLRDTPPRDADPEVLRLQAWLLGGAVSGVLPWPGQGEVPSLEGFDVLHQLLAVVLRQGVQGHLTETCGLAGPERPPQRRNRSFEDFDLPDRRLLLRQLAFLLEDWPHRLLRTCEAAGVTKEPLVVNFRPVPPWYEAVADRLSRANGRRPYKRVPLEPHLTLEELAARRDAAPTPAEQRRWDLIWQYAQQEEPAVLPFVRATGFARNTVVEVVRRYNQGGLESIENWWRGKKNPRRRLLTPEQEEELRRVLARGYMTNAEMADWVEARTGTRPDRSTLWMYRRGVNYHTMEGRRAGT
ncbi:hypothetical protein DAETH_11930 [Deinococcus aetherius]|uniref:TniQ domain-containing protein n=1 Tax=Deinococcus aetherius TaxID=200252 RepID=A0ABM8ABW6_9DEIO|nr:hypothetical protein DAETH_11930 [Deinococcus aetherius]